MLLKKQDTFTAEFSKKIFGSFQKMNEISNKKNQHSNCFLTIGETASRTAFQKRKLTPVIKFLIEKTFCVFGFLNYFSKENNAKIGSKLKIGKYFDEVWFKAKNGENDFQSQLFPGSTILPQLQRFQKKVHNYR